MPGRRHPDTPLAAPYRWLCTTLALALATAGCGACATKSRVPPPPPEAGYDGPVAYNAVLTPAHPAGSNVLTVGVPAILDFYVGPQNPISAIPSDQQLVPDGVLLDHGFTPLTLTLNCAFCDGDVIQTQRLVYDASARLSTIAKFTLVPSRLWRSGPDVSVVVSVSRDGVERDRLSIPLRLRDTAGATGASPAKATLRFDPNRLNEKVLESPAGPDVVLRVGRDANETLTVGLDAVSIASKAALEKATPASGTSLSPSQTFRSGNLTVQGLTSILVDQYVAMKAMIEQDEQLSRALTGDATASPDLVIPGITLSSEARDLLLRRFCEAGQYLYAELFRDPRLLSAVEALEGLELGRPLRIQIESPNLFAPWQYLHPPGPCMADAFWGFRFEIVANPIIDLPGGLPTRSSWVRDLTTAVFLAFRGESDLDQVKKYGAKQIELLRQSAAPRSQEIVAVDQKADFVKALTLKRQSVGLIVVFAHASNGFVVQNAGPGRYFLAEDPLGPHIVLSANDRVRANDIYALRLGLRLSEVRTVLENNPVVFVNACETGAVGTAPANALGLAETFLKLGARAVVVTEAPVWVLFGHRFGADLTAAIAGGARPSDALLALRRRYLAENNPLGLLYTYYGDGTSVFKASGN